MVTSRKIYFGPDWFIQPIMSYHSAQCTLHKNRNNLQNPIPVPFITHSTIIVQNVTDVPIWLKSTLHQNLSKTFITFLTLSPINSLNREIHICHLKLFIFILMSRIDILSISCEIALRWAPQDLTIDYRKVSNIRRTKSQNLNASRLIL